MEDGHRYEVKTDLPLDELRDAIAARAAADARILRAVSRCADTGTFRDRGCRSMTDWLSTEFAIGVATAKEWVFLSKKLREVPAISEAFERGRLTWEQLRPLCRFATPEDDRHWAEAARHLYPSQLWRELQRRTRPRLKDERDAHASRYLSLVWDRDDPVLNVYGRPPREGAGLGVGGGDPPEGRGDPLDEDARTPPRLGRPTPSSSCRPRAAGSGRLGR